MKERHGPDAKERGKRPSLLRLGPTGRIWLLTAVIASIAFSIFWTQVRGLPFPAAPVRIPWLVLAAVFALAEVFVVHVEFRRDSYSFSVSEVPLVLGLLFTRPEHLMLAQLVGAGAALLIHRRQSPLRLTFNLSHLALEAGLALLIFHGAFGVQDPFGPMAWVATFLAVFVANTVADLCIGLAISFSEGRIKRDVLIQGLPFGMIATVVNTSLSLTSATIVWVSPESSWLLLVPAATLFIAYRAYIGERQKHESLELLYDTMHRIQRSLFGATALKDLLEAVRKMFRAEMADIIFVARGEAGATRTGLGPDEAFVAAVPTDLDPTQGVWARAVAEGQAVLVARPIENERLREHFESEGIRDVMVAPLAGEDEEVVGILRVANRMGDVTTFDAEDLKLFESLAIHASTALENARLVERLKESLERLTESNRIKDDFVATVSHELRTPLTVMRGFIKTLLREDVTFSAEQQVGFLEAADRGGERLHGLIEQLLTVSRIEANREPVAMAPVPIQAIVERAISDFDSRREDHAIEVKGVSTLPTVLTDGAKVQQIVSNLIENALKYSPPGSTVMVEGTVEKEKVVVRVMNEGAGIPEDLHERIFDRFFQIDSSATRDVGGTGLGLYICRRLSEEVGANLALERSGADGTVFTLTIPHERDEENRPNLRVVSGA